MGNWEGTLPVAWEVSSYPVSPSERPGPGSFRVFFPVHYQELRFLFLVESLPLAVWVLASFVSEPRWLYSNKGVAAGRPSRSRRPGRLSSKPRADGICMWTSFVCSGSGLDRQVLHSWVGTLLDSVSDAGSRLICVMGPIWQINQ